MDPCPDAEAPRLAVLPPCEDRDKAPGLLGLPRRLRPPSIQVKGFDALHLDSHPIGFKPHQIMTPASGLLEVPFQIKGDRWTSPANKQSGELALTVRPLLPSTAGAERHQRLSQKDKRNAINHIPAPRTRTALPGLPAKAR